MDIQMCPDNAPLWENAFYGVDCSGLWWAACNAANNDSTGNSPVLATANQYHNDYVSLRQVYDDQGQLVSSDNDTNGDCVEDHPEPDWVRNRVSRFIESGDAWFIDWDKDPGDRYPVDHMGIVSSYVPESKLQNRRPNDPPPFTIIHASARSYRRVVRPDYVVTWND